MAKFGTGILKYKQALKNACNIAMVDLGKQEVEVYKNVLEEKDLVATRELYNSVGYSTLYQSSENENDPIKSPTKEFEVNIGVSAPYARDVNDGYAGGHVEFNEELIENIWEWAKAKGVPINANKAHTIAKNLADNGHVALPFHNIAFNGIKNDIIMGAFNNAFYKALKIELQGTENTDKVG